MESFTQSENQHENGIINKWYASNLNNIDKNKKQRKNYIGGSLLPSLALISALVESWGTNQTLHNWRKVYENTKPKNLSN